MSTVPRVSLITPLYGYVPLPSRGLTYDVRKNTLSESRFERPPGAYRAFLLSDNISEPTTISVSFVVAAETDPRILFKHASIESSIASYRLYFYNARYLVLYHPGPNLENEAGTPFENEFGSVIYTGVGGFNWRIEAPLSISVQPQRTRGERRVNMVWQTRFGNPTTTHVDTTSEYLLAQGAV